jgi:hypothetical protein
MKKRLSLRSDRFMKKHVLLWRNVPASKGDVVLMAAIPAWASVSAASGDTTAWQNGQLVMDTAGVVQRSNIILQTPNLQSAQSMPLGNGMLGATAWSANGLTVRLNRTDTFPDRKAVGQVVLSGLTNLTWASMAPGAAAMRHPLPLFSMGRRAQFFNPTFKRLNLGRNTFSGRNRKGGEAVLLPC